VPPAPSMWLGALFSAVLGNLLPGPGTLYESQSLRFLGRAHIGDELVVSVQVTGKRPPRSVVLATRIICGDDVLVEGVA
jgi:phosphate butyryltransferase